MSKTTVEKLVTGMLSPSDEELHIDRTPAEGINTTSRYDE
jgi:ABC-type bacteriocin/lantibiotic exporter with double-glycine peptidase domain